MTAKEILEQLEREQVKILVIDGQLSLTGEKSKITPHLLAEIQKYKSILISMLTNSLQDHADQGSENRRYRRDDGSFFDLNQDDFTALVDFVDMIYSFSFAKK